MDDVRIAVTLLAIAGVFCIGWFGALIMTAYCDVVEQGMAWCKIG